MPPWASARWPSWPSCMDLLGISREYGPPETFNSDHGSQFTSEAFTEPLLTLGVQISMDGRGAWRDNSRRPRSSLDKKTPDEFYFATLAQLQAAA